MKRNRWVLLILLSASVGLIYQLPYLRYSYYDPMLAAFNFNHVQLGNLMSAFGLGSVICYLIGGIVADRISSKYLLSVGQVLTGLAGLLFATFPSYPVALAISFFWAFSTSLIFWPALISFIKNLGNENEQGRLFGLLEGTRGIIATVVGLGIVAVFNYFGTGHLALRAVILMYAGINILLGIVTFFMVPKGDGKAVFAADAGEKQATIWNSFGAILKMPQAWFITITIFCTMMCFICLGYLTPYLTGVMGASVAFAATIGTLRTWGLQVVGGTSGGFIADKIRSASLTMVFAFLVIAIGFGVMLVIPSTVTFLMVATIVMFLFGFAIYINRGVYFATLTEAKIPKHLTGAVIGFASALGFTPDAFMYTLIGGWLDKYPGVTGYNMIFICAIISAAAGLLASLGIFKLAKKQSKFDDATVVKES